MFRGHGEEGVVGGCSDVGYLLGISMDGQWNPLNVRLNCFGMLIIIVIHLT